MKLPLDEVVIQYTEEISQQYFGTHWGEIIAEFKFMNTGVPIKDDVLWLNNKRWQVVYVETDLDSGIIRAVLRHAPAATASRPK